VIANCCGRETLSSSSSCSSVVLEKEGIRVRERGRRTRRSARGLICTILLLAGAMSSRAAVDPVAIKVPEAKAYTGQRLPFFVELLRAAPLEARRVSPFRRFQAQ
jgi:hypothetical protein